LEYLNKIDLFKSRAAKWQRDNPERYRSNIRAYLDRSDIKTAALGRTKQWRKDNPDHARYLNGINSARWRAQCKQACPEWLTVEHHDQIKHIYATCPPDHHVDHIVPLRGDGVCGLHVPWNLQHLPADENMSKGNTHD